MNFKRIMALLVLFTVTRSASPAEENVEYMISWTNNLNLREGPGINYNPVYYITGTRKETMQLIIAQSVKVLKNSDSEEIINGNKGHWVYVDTGAYDLKRNESIKGWVFDYYLAKKEDFRPLNSLPENLELKFGMGDALVHYKFYKDGRAEYIHDNERNKGKIDTGRLYIEKRNLIVVIKWDEHKDLFLWSDEFLFKNGTLCVPGCEDGRDCFTCAKVVK